MRFVWTHEPRNVLLLRCPKGGPRAHIGHREDGTGYVAAIIEPGWPGSPVFKDRYKAALWAADYIKREMFPDAEIEDPPRYVFASSEAVKKRRERKKASAWPL
jgi:hypothetical protein